MSGRFSCDLCEKYFLHKYVLKQHMENKLLNIVSEQDPDGKYCGFCQKFIVKKNYKDHMRQKHKRMKCEICDKAYFNKHSFESHKRSHKVEFTCDDCNRKFKLKRTLEQHILRVHLRKAPHFKCDHCRKIMSSSSTLIRHIRNVHQKKYNYACDICEKGFSYAKLLSDHLAFVHLNQQNYFCSSCNKYFKCNRNLRSHLNRIHRDQPGDQPRMKCGKCDRTYLVRLSYQKHLKMHESRPFTCTRPFCKYMFFESKEALENHVSAVHDLSQAARLSMYNCDQCDKSYKTPQHLQRHVDIEHLGLLYQCDVCGKKSGRKDYIREHLLKQHFRKRWNPQPHQLNIFMLAFCIDTHWN